VLKAGDAVIDGGNAFCKDDIHRAAALKQRRVHDIAVGTTGDRSGRERGCCLTIGVEKEIPDRAIHVAVDVNILCAALARFRSRRIAEKSCSAMRNGFRRLKALQS
jgi:6-phosphogluconate dehydrogenase (decarboxylating)